MQIGLGIGATFRRKWVPPLTEQIRSLLFGSGQQGAWYDPSDLSTLFQDSAGTVPVTAMEQPVGRMLDLSGNGNHAFQATTTKRGVVSALVNGFTATEDISQAAWIKRQVTVSGVDKIQEDSSTNLHYVRQDVSVFAGVYTLSFEAKQSERTIAWASLDGSSNTRWFDLVNGVSGGLGGGSSKITSIGDGWYKCEYIVTKTAGTAACFVGLSNSTTITNYPGVTGSGIFLRKLAIATQGTAYQRVNTATDYDADPAKFPAYLRFDGVDDALQTGNIDFTSTDKMTAWAGVTNFGKTTSVLSELSAVFVNNPGSWGLTGYEGGAFAAFARAASLGNRNMTSPEIVGKSRVQTAMFNLGSTIVNEQVQLRNLSLIAPGVGGGALVGDGNFGNYPLYIGARAGSSLYFNGRLYSLIVRGAQSSLSQIEATELYIKQKMRLP